MSIRSNIKDGKMKKLLVPFSIILLAALSAFNYHVFIFPNSFAPTGLDGILAMVQHLSGINMGYYVILANVPLLLIAYKMLDKRFIWLTALYIISFSVAGILFDLPIFESVTYYTDIGTSIVLAPVAGGTIRGILYAATIYLGGSAGGLDIPAAMIRHAHPHLNIMSIIFVFNVGVAILAFFVYGFRLEPVICSIVYSFITSTTSKSLSAKRAARVRVDIITPHYEQVHKVITDTLGLGATVVDARGAFTGQERKLVICVVEAESVPKLEGAIRELTDTVIFKSTASI